MRAPSIAELELQYADSLGAPAAVILPSVRSGILMALKAVAGTKSTVIGPAYSCLVVHEAMALSGATVRYIEPAPRSYLMSVPALRELVRQDGCVVFSEIYGIPYDIKDLDGIEPRLRLLDMAMSVPDPQRMQNLKAFDVALFSFGIGKSMCAGGGGVACFGDRALAAQIREMRDTIVAGGSRTRRRQHDASVLASVAMRTRLLCGPSTVATEMWRAARHGIAQTATTTRAMRADNSNASSYAPGPEWTHVMTPMERRLAARNLHHAAESAAVRRAQSNLYTERLRIHELLPSADEAMLSQSHFPIRVPASLRDPLRLYLRRRGIDTGEEFPISGMLRSQLYPRTTQLTNEVVTLPLGEQVADRDIEFICSAAIEGFGRVRQRQAMERGVA